MFQVRRLWNGDQTDWGLNFATSDLVLHATLGKVRFFLGELDTAASEIEIALEIGEAALAEASHSEPSAPPKTRVRPYSEAGRNRLLKPRLRSSSWKRCSP